MTSSALPSSFSVAFPQRADLRGDATVLACLVLLLVVVRGFAFGSPVYEMDDQLYSFVGWRMLHGELPFADWWDRKPFGLFALFAFAHAIGGPGPEAFQVLANMSVLGGAWLVYRAARPLCDRPGAALAAGYMIVLLTLFSGASGQSEAFHAPLMIAAMFLVRNPDAVDFRRRALASMAICGLTLQVKYTVLPQCLFLGLWCLWVLHGRPANWSAMVRDAALFAAIGLIPTVAVAAFYAWVGEFEAFWFANFVSFFLREGYMESRFHPRQALWLLPLSLPLLFAALYWKMQGGPRVPRLYAFYAAWSLSVLATVLLPSTIYLFYLAALAPCIALLATPFLAQTRLLNLAPAALVLYLLTSIMDLPERYAVVPAEAEEARRFAAEIARYVDGTDKCLYVFDGTMSFYRLSGGCRMTRLIYPDHLNNRLEAPAVGILQEVELARILANKPAVLVTASEAVTPQNPRSTALIADAITRDYAPLAQADINNRIITAWRRVR